MHPHLICEYLRTEKNRLENDVCQQRMSIKSKTDKRKYLKEWEGSETYKNVSENTLHTLYRRK